MLFFYLQHFLVASTLENKRDWFEQLFLQLGVGAVMRGQEFKVSFSSIVGSKTSLGYVRTCLKKAKAKTKNWNKKKMQTS